MPYETILWVLPESAVVTGVRVRGPVGGATGFVTIAELDALGARVPAPPAPSFDIDGDGQIDIDDLHAFFAGSGVDFDGDGAADGQDARYLQAAVRWGERAAMSEGWE